MIIRVAVKSVAFAVQNDAGEAVLEYQVKDLNYIGDIGSLAQAIADNQPQIEAAAKVLVEAFGAAKTKVH